MESLVNFGEEQVHTNVQFLTEPGFETQNLVTGKQRSDTKHEH